MSEVEDVLVEASISTLTTYSVCPFGSIGLSYKPFPITGYPSELKDILENVPNDQTSADAHPLLRGQLRDCPWRTPAFSEKKSRRCNIPKRILMKMPDHVLKRMGQERPKGVAEKNDTPNKKYCLHCKVLVSVKKYSKHTKTRGHVEKICLPNGRTPGTSKIHELNGHVDNVRFSKRRIPDMTKVYEPKFPFGMPLEDELDFPRFKPIQMAPPPCFLPPLSYPLIPHPHPIYCRERPPPPMINSHYAGGCKTHAKPKSKKK